MVVLRAIVVGMEGVFQEVRLRALKESPWAFGATYEREVGMTEGEWAERVRQRDGERAVGYLAFEGEERGGRVGLWGDIWMRVGRRWCIWFRCGWRRRGGGVGWGGGVGGVRWWRGRREARGGAGVFDGDFV